MKNLIYISGSGRSGSTVVERILNSSPDVVATGEVHCLWRLPNEAITCSCGSKMDADGYWRECLARAGLEAATLARLAQLERTVCRSKYIADHGFSLDRLRREPEVREFLEIQFRLFESVAAYSGRPIVVDSSKAGPRAWLLACDPRTRILHIYRKPVDVIASWRSRKFDPGLATQMQRLSVREAALDWWKVEYLARRLATRNVVGRIDYQNFCDAPRVAVEQALAELGLADVRPPQWLDDNLVRAGESYHSLNGNPDRFDRGPIKIVRRDPDWSRLTRVDRILASSVGGLLGRLYPFQIRAEAH